MLMLGVLQLILCGYRQRISLYLVPVDSLMFRSCEEWICGGLTACLSHWCTWRLSRNCGRHIFCCGRLEVDEVVMMTAVQKLYDLCRTTFTVSTAPTPQALHRVRAVLDCIKSADVGLSEEEAKQQERGIGFFGVNGRRGRHTPMVSRWAPPISYIHLHECEDFSMGIFCLPTSAQIPLHNHPGMTVFSKLLYGSLHVKAYDWVDPFDEKLNSDPSIRRSAKLVVDRVHTAPCETTTLHPTSGGNIHAFTAITPCAVLDVFAPPYNNLAGRHCTYYRELPSFGRDAEEFLSGEHIKNEIILQLEEFQPPDDFIVLKGEYRGPRVDA